MGFRSSTTCTKGWTITASVILTISILFAVSTTLVYFLWYNHHNHNIKSGQCNVTDCSIMVFDCGTECEEPYGNGQICQQILCFYITENLVLSSNKSYSGVYRWQYDYYTDTLNDLTVAFNCSARVLDGYTPTPFCYYDQRDVHSVTLSRLPTTSGKAFALYVTFIVLACVLGAIALFIFFVLCLYMSGC